MNNPTNIRRRGEGVRRALSLHGLEIRWTKHLPARLVEHCVVLNFVMLRFRWFVNSMRRGAHGSEGALAPSTPSSTLGLPHHLLECNHGVCFTWDCPSPWQHRDTQGERWSRTYTLAMRQLLPVLAPQHLDIQLDWHVQIPIHPENSEWHARQLSGALAPHPSRDLCGRKSVWCSRRETGSSTSFLCFIVPWAFWTQELYSWYNAFIEICTR